MIVEVRVTELPESVEDGTLLLWHKKPGDEVKPEEALAEIETDKVVLEIAAPSAGVLGPLLRQKGESVKRGDVLTTIDAVTAPVATPAASRPADQPQTSPPEGAGDVQTDESRDGMAPAVRRLLREHQLAASDVIGTGPRGRITKEDVLRHLESSPQVSARIGEAPAVVEISQTAPSEPEALNARPSTRVKMSRLRARIAARMLEAQHNAAILTTFNQVNMQALMDLRHHHRETFQSQHGVKLGIMSFFVKACSEALKRYPVVNASLDGEEVVYHGYFDIGVAVSTSRGLVVPVLRNADRMNLADIERSIASFASRGEDGKLSIEELTGGTFTISNGGIFGSMLSTPILNPPQSAILGLHGIEPRPVAEGDTVVIRPMMYLALSYDHRIIDGREAVLFLVAIKELIEDPTRFILQV
jgi:2-oxoglutarate dehydrogenase E2 component (dihydrolipoamide succinyltransferase)